MKQWKVDKKKLNIKKKECLSQFIGMWKSRKEQYINQLLPIYWTLRES